MRGSNGKSPLKSLFGVVIIILFIGIVLFFWPHVPREADEVSQVTWAVQNFGTALKNVPLLAEREEAADMMQAHYATYVSPRLLSEWMNNPMRAPGRLTSSPSPDHIEIAAIQKRQMEPLK